MRKLPHNPKPGPVVNIRSADTGSLHSNKDVVVSLREIAAGKVFPVKDEDSGLLVEGLQEPALEALPGVESVALPDQEPAKGEVTSEDD